MIQKDVAKIIAVTEDSITNWENNLCEPEIRYLPSIIKFLGRVPFKLNLNLFAQKLKFCRLLKGLTHKQMGKMLNVDGTTVGSWDKGEHLPQKQRRQIIDQKVSELIRKLVQDRNEVFFLQND